MVCHTTIIEITAPINIILKIIFRHSCDPTRYISPAKALPLEHTIRS